MMLMGITPSPTKLVLLVQSSSLSSSYKKTIMFRKYSLSKVHVAVEARQAQFFSSHISHQYYTDRPTVLRGTSCSVGLDLNLDHADALVESLRSGNASARRRRAIWMTWNMGDRVERLPGAAVHAVGRIRRALEGRGRRGLRRSILDDAFVSMGATT
jgi:hypothetical protein